MGFMLTTVDTQRELAAEALLSKSVVLKQDSDFPEGFTSLLLGLGGLRFCCVANKMLVNKKHLLHIYIYIYTSTFCRREWQTENFHFPKKPWTFREMHGWCCIQFDRPMVAGNQVLQLVFRSVRLWTLGLCWAEIHGLLTSWEPQKVFERRYFC